MRQTGAATFFTFPEDAHWNAKRQAVEFGVEIGEYRGVVRVPRRVFRRSCRSGRPPSAASRRTTSSEPGSRASRSGRSVGGSWARTGMSRSAGEICANPQAGDCPVRPEERLKSTHCGRSPLFDKIDRSWHHSSHSNTRPVLAEISCPFEFLRTLKYHVPSYLSGSSLSSNSSCIWGTNHLQISRSSLT